MNRRVLAAFGRGLMIGACLFLLYAAVCWELDQITPFIYVVF